MIEVMRFAEQLGVVGRDRIDEILDFRLVLAEILAIIAKRIQLEHPQPARQATIGKIALGLRQHDAGMLVGKLREKPEIGVGEREFAARVV